MNVVDKPGDREELKLEVGAAYMFERVACLGIEAGQGDDHTSASQLGCSTAPPDVGRGALQTLSEKAAATGLTGVPSARLEMLPGKINS